MLRRFPSFLIAAVLCGVAIVRAEPPWSAAAPPAPAGISYQELFPWARFDPAIPTQEQVVGLRPGIRPLRHAELIEYLEALDQASPRARLETYGHTHEGRELVVFAVSEPETIARLDAFRDEHAARVDPRSGKQADLAEAKAVAWMAYGIHGDELSSVDAAAALAYWLVAGEDERAARLRRELVILIDPAENPDGRDRFLAQTQAFAHRTPSPDSEDLSHTTVWPWGRGNHYLFDLNRDWFTMVQPESRRSTVIAGWNPQLMVDSHEMGSDDTYLFSPPRHPFNPHMPPSQRVWWDRFAADQARALDERGYPYYSGEWNEEFFPGYGSSWAAYRGAVGILYEMSGTDGTLVRKRSGVVRTYPQAIEHQVTSSVANLETLTKRRVELLEDFVRQRRELVQGSHEATVTAWVLPRGFYPERTDALVRLLLAQGIEVLQTQSGRLSVSGLRDARTGDSIDSETLAPDAYLVPVGQPAGGLVRAILDPHVPMDATFFREEREHVERGRGTRLYETTAWSLPLAYGVEAYWTATRPPTAGWRSATVPEPLAAEQDPDHAEPSGAQDVNRDAFGWLIDGRSDAASFALGQLLDGGIAVRVAEKPFRAAGREWDRGALLVVREGNPPDVASRLAEITRREGVALRATSTAKAEEGPDLGGGYLHPLVAPRIGIWTGTPVSAQAYGALWHLLDEEMRLRFTGLDLSRYSSTDLSRYNVLVFPPVAGGTGAYREMLGAEGLARLKQWVEAGGTAIGIGGGSSFLADEKLELTKARLRSQVLERYPPVVLGPSAEEVAQAGLFRAVGLVAPRKEKDEDDEKDKGDERSRRPAPPTRSSPWDVAPLLGPGARPFAAGLAQGTAVPLEPQRLDEWLRPLLPAGTKEAAEDDLERADERLRRFAPRGAFLRVELDRELWLAWGLPAEIPALVRAGDALVAEPPVEVPARLASLERLHLGGLLWPEAAGRIAHTAWATREGVGRGQVILFLDEPAFRGFTLGTRRLLLNALLYGPGLGTRWSTPW